MAVNEKRESVGLGAELGEPLAAPAVPMGKAKSLRTPAAPSASLSRVIAAQSIDALESIDTAQVIELESPKEDFGDGKDFAFQAEGIYSLPDQLTQMDEWNQTNHGQSGLIERVRKSEVSEDQAVAETIAFLEKYGPEGVSPLCGNTIGQDRRFLRRYMPQLENYFH